MKVGNMQKIGALIAIISGIFQIVAGTLGILDIGGNIGPNIKGIDHNIYGAVVIALGAITVIFGIITFSKARSFSSIILFAVFVFNVVVLAVYGWSNTSQLVSLIINIIGATSIFIGFFTSKR